MRNFETQRFRRLYQLILYKCADKSIYQKWFGTQGILFLIWMGLLEQEVGRMRSVFEIDSRYKTA